MFDVHHDAEGPGEIVGRVRNGQIIMSTGRTVGNVSIDGVVTDRDGNEVGFSDYRTGDVYRGRNKRTAQKVGNVSLKGKIVDEQGVTVLYVNGSKDNMDRFYHAGAAALLMLLDPDVVIPNHP